MKFQTILLQAVLAAGPALGSPCKPDSCPLDVPLSCHNTTSVEDTCCFNYPGGQILLTQFWDTAPATGPEDSFTIHGLWPDNCDGTWEEYCDPSREYRNLTEMLTASAPDTLTFMNKYWKDYQGDDESFWEHEFDKHGTCMSPLEPKCYPNYQPGQEAVDYFKQTVKMFEDLPSYKWLAEAGIVPSTSATYTLADMQAALKSHHGRDVIINCRNGALSELWYHYNVKGSIRTGQYIAADPVGSPSSCPATGIKYLPKNAGSSPGTPTTTAPTPSGTPAPTGVPGSLSGKGRFYVSRDGAADGFLISGGKWYRAGGTPATYTATPNSDGESFTLKTSKGPCGIKEDSSIECAASVTDAASFGYDGQFLTYEGNNLYYAESAPSGTAQGTVYTTAKDVSFQVTWTAS